MVATYNGTIGNDSVIAGFDSMYGAHGNDLLASDQSGTDVVEGGRGDDELLISPGVNGTGYLYGGEGKDLVFGAENGDFIYGGGGNDVLLGMDFGGGLAAPVQSTIASPYSGSD
jgi:Ca2+-binding RTX toxin-like protein